MRYIFFLILMLAAIYSVEYFVSPSGSDSNSGLSESNAFKSIAYAAGKLNPGDTLYILPGKYYLSDYEKDIIRVPSGTQDKPIQIIGNNATLLAGNNLMAVIDLSGSSNILLKNIEITHKPGEFARDGIIILNSPSSNIILENIYIHHLDEFCLDVQDADNLQIRNSKFKYCGFGGLGGPAGNQGGIRNLRVESSEFSYSGYYYHGQTGPNIDRPYDRPDGIGLEESEGPVYISNCKFEHNRGDGLDLKTETAFVSRVLIANNFADGLKLWGKKATITNSLIYGRGDGDTTPTPWASIVINTQYPNAEFFFDSNTIDDYVGQNYLIHVQYDYPNIPVKVIFKNNIFSSRGENSGLYISGNSDFEFSNNIFYLPNNIYILEYGDHIVYKDISELPGNIMENPKFQSIPEENYHLSPLSPAINHSNTSLTIDLDGKIRTVPKDIGCYEFSTNRTAEEETTETQTTQGEPPEQSPIHTENPASACTPAFILTILFYFIMVK